MNSTLISILFGLTLVAGAAHADDAVLRPAYCKTERDYRMAPSRKDPHAWDMYRVANRSIALDDNRVIGSANFSFYQCSKNSDGTFGWKLFSEGRADSGVYLIGQGSWGALKHINVSDRGRIDVKTGKGAADLHVDQVMDSSQRSAFSRHQTVRDLQVVIAASQDNYVDGNYTPGNDISSEGMRLSFDLVFENGHYKVVRK